MAYYLSSLKKVVDYKLILLFLSLSSIILLRSYFDTDGGISPDSAFYLRLSENLLTGEGFRIPDYTSPDGKSFFAIWPVGYPVMIFIVSKLTGLGVVWASKALNILIVGFILLLFRYLFRENAHWAGLIFFVDSIVLVTYFTWSELPFVLFLICVSISLYKCVETSGRVIWLAALFFSGIALFMMRYIGLFSVGLIGLIALVNLFKRRWVLSVKLLIVASLQMIFAGLYLYNNKILTGYITGMPRNLPEESHRELINQFFAALREEFIVIKCGIPLTLSFALVGLLLIYLFMTRRKSHHDEKCNGLWKYFLLAGILYLISITGAKWFSNFTALDDRYLFPSSFLLLLSLTLFLQGKPKVKILNYPVVYLILWVTLTIHYIPNTDDIYENETPEIGYFQLPNYVENYRDILEKNKEVEPKSIVIFGSFHLRYLRDDINPTYIYGNNSLETMTGYFSRFKDWNVYINTMNDLEPETIHESFIRLMKTNSDKPVVKIQQRE